MNIYKDNAISENIIVITENGGKFINVEYVCPKEINEQESKVRDYRDGYLRGYVHALTEIDEAILLVNQEKVVEQKAERIAAWIVRKHVDTWGEWVRVDQEQTDQTFEFSEGYRVGYEALFNEIHMLMSTKRITCKEAREHCNKHYNNRLDYWTSEISDQMSMAPIPKILEPESQYDTYPKLSYRMSHEVADYIGKLIFGVKEEQ